jgi:guanylate kinase
LFSASKKRLGILFILVGPPGVGKNTLMADALARIEDLRQLPTATTRTQRPTEQNGREHHFVSAEEFQRLIDTHALLEWQEVHGRRYGTPRETLEKAIASEQDTIADIDVLGATYLRSLYPDNTVLIFIQPPRVEELKERMEKRGESQEEIENRMRRVDMEMQYAPLCDYLITNDDVTRASQQLCAIIIAERSRRALLNLRVARSLPRHRVVFSAAVLPVYAGEILMRRDPPHFPTENLSHGEFPHDAALRALDRALALTTSSEHLSGGRWSADLILPIHLHIEASENRQQLIFTYAYVLPERFAAPEGWLWQSPQETGLPTPALEALAALSREMVND